MKFTFSWLKQHLDTAASCDEICARLTSLGLEVESVEDRGKSLAPFIIAHVLTAEKHPNADRLKVALVDTGKEKLQVVCGAPNCQAGMKAVLARPGDIMPDSGEALKKGVIRGVESQGMLCAADELGLGDEHDGIIELPDSAPVGENYAQYAGLNDPVIAINLTPNRPDCAGVRGIARDLAAAGLGKLKPLEPKPIKGREKPRIKVKLDFPKGDRSCPLFAGRVIRNIKNGPSPLWLQKRLSAIGLRPISTLVDITNYLTFDIARPLHVFDANKIKGDLRVRAAVGGEKLNALNGKEYDLEAGMTVIADDSGVLSLGGIMGGVASSCDEKTTDVFIESAWFDPIRIARTGRALQIASDARYRFERGVDPTFTVPGLELATALIIDMCGTSETVVGNREVAGVEFENENVIAYDPWKCQRRTGLEVPVEEQEQILTRLGFDVRQRRRGLLSVTAPSWRPDIEGEADLVEEVVRVKGYDNILPVLLPHPTALPAASVADARANMAKRALAAQGLLEAVTWSFMPSNIAALFDGGAAVLKIENPISSDLDAMRPSILGNLVMAAKRNADRGFADVGLFEIGPVFKNVTTEGQRTVAAALRAGSTPRNWAAPSRPIDAFDAKADALAALIDAGAPVASLQITTDAPPWYHPGRSGVLRLGPVVLACFGEIHPHVLLACDATGPMAGCEVFLDVFPQARGGAARPLLKLEPLQPVVRDFAFVVDSAVTAAKLIKAVREVDRKLIREVTVFDVYEGDKVGAGRKSVALSVTLQPTDKTLTDAEIEGLAARVTQSVAKATGGSLRA